MSTTTEALPVTASLALGTVPYLPKSEMDVVVRSIMELPVYPESPRDTTPNEMWELWTMHFLSNGNYYQARKELAAAYTNAGNADCTCSIMALLSGAMSLLSVLVSVTSGSNIWLAGGTSAVIFAGLCVTFRARFKKHEMRVESLSNALNKMQGTLWHKAIVDTLTRADIPQVPPILVRLARILHERNAMANNARMLLNMKLSAKDHVGMMRLTDKLQGASRIMFGDDIVVKLDGDTQELCSRVLDVIGKVYPEIKDVGPTVLRF